MNLLSPIYDGRAHEPVHSQLPVRCGAKRELRQSSVTCRQSSVRSPQSSVTVVSLQSSAFSHSRRLQSQSPVGRSRVWGLGLTTDDFRLTTDDRRLTGFTSLCGA